jgi:hypothetical protein
MKLRLFVSSSAVVLVAWLAITFVHDVPTQSYPKLDKYRRSTGVGELPERSSAPDAETATGLLQVSLSP